MYDSLGLAALKDDAMEVGAAAVGTVAGIAVAKFVTSKLAGSDGFLRDAADKTKFMFPGADKVSTLVPVAVGVAIYSFGANRMGRGAGRDAVAGVAAGMVAYGLGSLVASFTAKPEDTAKTFGLSGMGDVYDYSLSGYGPGDISAYMMNGAPTTYELAAAPVDIQTVTPFNGAPVSANVIGGPAPISTALVA